MDSYEQYVMRLDITINQLEGEIDSFSYHIANASSESVRCCMRRELDRLVLSHSELLLKKIQVDRIAALWNHVNVGNNLGDTMVLSMG